MPPAVELQWWYQFYFATERGRAGYEKYRRDFAKLIWQLASPKWNFSDATFERSDRNLRASDRRQAGAPREAPGVRRVGENRLSLVAPAHVPGMWHHLMLRQLAERDALSAAAWATGFIQDPRGDTYHCTCPAVI